jgi:pyruvate/2-oxoglutarate dehydrogenase complex dihydrolipoamide acyltransferase (E2) component
MEKTLDISEVKGAKANISDLVVYGDGDTFRLLCKASSQDQGWMKSTKVCNVAEGCIVQVTTQQRNPDGSYAVAEAVTYVPGVMIDIEANPRRLVAIAEGK